MSAAPHIVRWTGPGEDLGGFVFDQLTVESPAPTGDRGVRVTTRCTCGRIAVRYVADLVSGAARACSVCRPAEAKLRREPQRSPELRAFFREPAVLDRFFAKVIEEPNTGCYLWTAAVDRDGYGKFQLTDVEASRRAGRQVQYHVRAHRFALAIRLDRWPLSHLLACHRCDVPACVRPDHLREGTQKSNLAEMKRRGRTGRRGWVPPESRPRGDRHGQTKIPDAEIRTILRRRRRGEPLQRIADDYRVHWATIQAICVGRSPRVARLGLEPVPAREQHRRAS